MPVTQLTLSEEDQETLLPKKRLRGFSDRDPDDQNLLEKVEMALRHPKFQPIKSMEDNPKVLISQIETSISETTPLKNELPNNQVDSKERPDEEIEEAKEEGEPS